MTKEEIEKAAEQLYNACPTPKPYWRQLGPGTQAVWRERVIKQLEKETK